MSTNARNGATAERLVEALCDLPLADWRRVALAAVADRRAPLAAAALEQALRRADLVRLWELYDDLETALYRLTTDEARGVVRGWRERACIRAATRSALAALVCRSDLGPDHLRTLAGPWLRIMPGEREFAESSSAGGSPLAPRDAAARLARRP